MTKLIIGKNSSLVKKLRANLNEFNYISHTDIGYTNMNLYSEVYIFSYSRNSVEENIQFINKILHENIFYISTVAVFSLGYSGDFYEYPKIKNEVEKYCLNRGIKVIRIGSFENADYFKKTIAVTTTEMIVAYFEEINKPELKNLFYIDSYKENFFGHLYEKIFQAFSNQKYLALLLAITSKIFQKKLYGYSYAANSCLKEHIQIGYGALGSRSNPSDMTHIVISNNSNLKLTENGFNGFLIGKKKQGLGSLWHGVYTSACDNNKSFVKKKILRKNKLIKPKKTRLEIYPVNFINNDGDFWIICSKYNKKKLITNKLSLAAGPIENIRLLSCLEKIDVSLNDDEVFFAGTISSNEPYLTHLLKIGRLFVKQKYLHHTRMQDGYLLIDVRPYIPHKANNLDQNFYNSSLIQIIYKLITKFSIFRINEAFFNLYGFGIKTRIFSIYCQYSKINSINIRANQGHINKLIKKRANYIELMEINNHLLKLFNSFKRIDSQITTVDGQHVSGGEEILFQKKILKHINDSSLNIIGLPSKKFEDALHTTFRLFPNEL